MRVGVLALQGGFEAHARVLRRLGAEVRPVRTCAQLDGVQALVLPGGESSALLTLMAADAWFDALRRVQHRGAAIFGTCAGCILLARDVHDPVQSSAALIDLSVRRNAYGRQAASFEAVLQASELGPALPGVFIRAPRIDALGPDVEVLARYDQDPVLVRQGRVLCATFHPELTEDTRVHALFLRSAAVA
jgi:5'-phosphate synthase pdxT subunit